MVKHGGRAGKLANKEKSDSFISSHGPMPRGSAKSGAEEKRFQSAGSISSSSTKLGFEGIAFGKVAVLIIAAAAIWYWVTP